MQHSFEQVNWNDTEIIECLLTQRISVSDVLGKFLTLERVLIMMYIALLLRNRRSFPLPFWFASACWPIASFYTPASFPTHWSLQKIVNCSNFQSPAYVKIVVYKWLSNLPEQKHSALSFVSHMHSGHKLRPPFVDDSWLSWVFRIASSA